MAALKTMFVLVLIAVVLASTMASINVGPCNQVCSRTRPERDECCRAHGYSQFDVCKGGRMWCD